MLKSASLNACWHDRPAANFTIVRSIGTGGGVTPCMFNSLGSCHVKNRSTSEPFAQRGCDKLSRSSRSSRISTTTTDFEACDLSVMERTSDTQSEININGSACSSCTLLFNSSHLVVSFEGALYHTSCFVCAECGQVVDPTSQFLLLENGGPLCPLCTPSCQICRRTITSGHVGVLNKDFHEECLKCCHCQKVFHKLSKVYASGSEPCCAECVTPVFGSEWNQPDKGGRIQVETKPEHEKLHRTLSEPPLSIDLDIHNNLPPRLESLSQAVSDLPSARFHTLLRPSVSYPICLSDSPSAARKNPKLSLSSLRAILYDELGVSLLMNFCVEDSSIELLLFWLDVEHFKYFDGNEEDTMLFAHHIMLKYIGYYAELPVGLPKTLEDHIVAEVQVTPHSQEVFDEAQSYVYEIMENSVLARFLQSKDGQSYLRALVTRDNDKRQKHREVNATDTSRPMTATVVSFDKRHLQTKFYVYCIRVERNDRMYIVYRRYSDFYALHQELKATFQEVPFPPMPKKIFFGRSQTKNVAHLRLGDLNHFLQSVLVMSAEISNSSLVQQFLTQTQTDKDDESFDSRVQS